MGWKQISSIVLALLLSAGPGACGKEKPKPNPKPAKIQPKPTPWPKAKKKKSAKKEGYLDRGLSLGKSALSRSKRTGKALAQKTKKLGTEAYGKTRRWGKSSVDDVRGEAVAILRAAKGNTVAAGEKINALLHSLAKHPDEKMSVAEKVARMVVLMVPIVGPTKRYADARKMYEVGTARKDPAMVQKARREALIAFVEAGLDIGVLGLVGAKVDLIATGADKVLTMLKASRAVGTLVGTNLKTFDALLDSILKSDSTRKSIDNALTMDLAKIGR